MLGLRKILDRYGGSMMGPWSYEDKIKEFTKGTTMSLNEFKQWLRGFSESFADSHPNSSEWKRIQEELSKVKEGNYPSPYIPSPTIAPPNWSVPQYPPGVRDPLVMGPGSVDPFAPLPKITCGTTKEPQ